MLGVVGDLALVVVACYYLHRAARGDLPVEDESSEEDDDTEPDDESGSD